MNKNKSQKKEYTHRFCDGVMFGDAILGLGLKEPKLAGKYALRFLDITENLLEGNYKIIDCKAHFSDDDYGSYGEMQLIKDGKRIVSDIERWNEYYLNGPGKSKREVCKDLIDRCTLYMNLSHITGRPSLSVDAYHVTNETDKRKRKKHKFKLYHSISGKFDDKTGKFIKCSSSAWSK